MDHSDWCVSWSELAGVSEKIPKHNRERFPQVTWNLFVACFWAEKPSKSNFQSKQGTFGYIYGSVSRVATPPPHGMGPPPPPIPHTFCTRHCSETYISILLHARRCSETHIFILLDEPSRRIRWVDRAKLWRNANFKLQEWLRAVYRTLQCSANGIIYIYISMYIHIHKHQ